MQLAPRPFREQLTSLGEGALDVGFYTGPRPAVPGLAVEVLLPMSVDAAMLPSDHPLAAVKELWLEDLSGFPFHSLSQEYAPEIMDGVHESMARGGWRGRTTPGSLQPSEIITAVSCGVGWATAPSDRAGWTPAAVVVVPLADEPLVGLDVYVLWRDEAPFARDFVRLAFELREVIGARPRPEPHVPAQAEMAFQRLVGQRYAERARIAHELHDTLLQDLAGSQLQLEALRRRLPAGLQRENEELDRTVDRLERAAREVRTVLGHAPSAHPRPRDLVLVLAGAAEEVRRGSPAALRISTEAPRAPFARMWRRPRSA